MANTFLLKRSSTGGEAPTAASLTAGELAINTTDMRLFSEDAGGVVHELAGATVTASLRAGHILTGGGTISVSSGGGISWSLRFMVMNSGRGSHFSTTGYYDINMPADGTVITGYAGASDVTVASGEIVFGGWQALYYELPINSLHSTLSGNFKLVGYTSNFKVPPTWVLIAARNGDSGPYVKFGTGVVLRNGESYNQTLYSSRRVPRADLFTTARTINGVSFDGSANITIEDATKLPLAGGTITGNLAVDGSTTLGSGAARLFIANTGTTPGRNYFVGRNSDDTAWAFTNEFGWDQAAQRWYFDDELSVGNHITAKNLRAWYETRIMPTVVGNCVQIGTFDLLNGAIALRLAISVSDTNFCVTKFYEIASKYSPGGTGWRIVVPTSDSGVWAGNDFTLEARVDTASPALDLRIRRASGTTAGTAIIYMQSFCSADLTFTPSTLGVISPAAVTLEFTDSHVWDAARTAAITSISSLTPAADRLPYFTGASTAALATFTTFGRSLVDDADATAGRTTLGLGTIATQAASSVAITGGTAYGLTNLAVGHSAVVSSEVGGNIVTPKLLAAEAGGNAAIMAARYGATTTPSALVMAKSRNAAVGSHTVVTTGDQIGVVTFAGSDGAGFIEAARIIALAEGTFSTGVVPGRLSLEVTQASGTAPSEVLRFNNAGGAFFPLVGTTASAANAFLNNASSPANQLLRSTSSLRYKEDVTDLTPEMSSRVLKLRPVRYRSKAEADRKDWTFYGFIAEEVAEIEPRLVHYIREELEPITVERQTGTTEDGTPIITTEVVPQYSDKLLPDGVMYDRVVVLLLHCVQGLSARLEALEAKLS